MDKKQVAQLMKKKNVVSVGTGTKVHNGVSTGRSAVVVGVSKKEPLADLATRDIIPSSVDNQPTDVIEVGEIKALGGVVTRVRPCPGGISVGSFRITAGTLASWVHKGSQPMLLSNNHVLADVNNGKAGDSIVQPGKYDGGLTPDDTIAVLDSFVPIKFIGGSIWQMFLDWLFRRQPPLNTVDCALAAPLEGPFVDPTIVGVGIPAGTREAELGMTVKKSGRTTGLTSGPITQVGVTARVSMGGGKTAVFADQIMVQSAGFSAGGDSGSLILTDDNSIVGLLFAGSEAPPVTLFCRFANVATALGITP